MMSLTFLASIAWGQTRPLSGTVIGDNGVPLVGASVTQKKFNQRHCYGCEW